MFLAENFRGQEKAGADEFTEVWRHKLPARKREANTSAFPASV